MRSSFCNFGDCLEVEFGVTGIVYVRNTALPELALVFTHEEWTSFVAGVRNGEFDLPVAPPTGDGPQT